MVSTVMGESQTTFCSRLRNLNVLKLVAGVKSVTFDRWRNSVIVTGNVDKFALLRILRSIDHKAKFVELNS